MDLSSDAAGAQVRLAARCGQIPIGTRHSALLLSGQDVALRLRPASRFQQLTPSSASLTDPFPETNRARVLLAANKTLGSSGAVRSNTLS